MKPRVLTRCAANNYTAPNERVIEFSSKNGGGLISFRTSEDGNLDVHVYRCDSTVRVFPPSESPDTLDQNRIALALADLAKALPATETGKLWGTVGRIADAFSIVKGFDRAAFMHAASF
jgi:hypothetical protein